VPHESAPATVVILARVPAGTTAEEFAKLDDLQRRRSAAVTWVVDGADLDRFAAQCPAARSALALDADCMRSRQDLRRVLGRAQSATPALDAVVVVGGTAIVHRDVLVDSGIRTAVVERFDETSRGSRRPAPGGWPCRSILWGLWEVEASPAKTAGMIGRWIPWGGHPTAGSLTVISIAAQGSGTRDLVDRLSRAIDRHTGAGHAARFALVAELPAMLGSVGQPQGGSVLRAA